MPCISGNPFIVKRKRNADWRSSQSVKEHQFSKSENWCFGIDMKKSKENVWKT